MVAVGARRVARQEKSVYKGEGTGGVTRSLRGFGVRRRGVQSGTRLGNHRVVVKVFCQSVNVKAEQREALGCGSRHRNKDGRQASRNNDQRPWSKQSSVNTGSQPGAEATMMSRATASSLAT